MLGRMKCKLGLPQGKKGILPLSDLACRSYGERRFIKKIDKVYFEYHAVELCHGSEIIYGRQFRKIKKQINKMIKTWPGYTRVPKKIRGFVADSAWESSLKRFNNTTNIQTVKRMGLGKSMTWERKSRMKTICDYAIRAINKQESENDYMIMRLGEGKKKKRF